MPLRNSAGEISGVLGTYLDVSEQVRARETLRASELRYRRLFESAKDGILILDAETGMIVDVNPFLVDLLGYSREEILGRKLWELGFFKDVVASQDNFAELQQRKYVRYDDLPLETRDGRRIEVEFVSNVYHGQPPEGDPVQHPRHHRAPAGGEIPRPVGDGRRAVRRDDHDHRRSMARSST